MIRYLLHRLAQACAVVLAVALIGFAVFQHIGDPVVAMLGQDATPQQRERLRADLGIDRAFPIQFARFAGRAVQGDFGLSYRQGRKVSTMLLERLPATAELASIALIFSLLIGVPTGVWVAIRPRRPLSVLIQAGTLLGVSLPTFLTGIGLIMLFSVGLGWLPSHGRGETIALGWWRTSLLGTDGWRHLIMPMLTLSFFQVAMIVRLVRTEMQQVLRSDHIRFARARGIPERRILFRHALRNALLPVVTIVGMQFGTVLAFAIVTETVFQWPGLGLLFLQAVQDADIPVLAAYLCLVGFTITAINLAVDLLYLAIDPRLRDARGAADMH